MTFENRTAGVDVFCFSFAFVVAKDDSLNYLGSLVRVRFVSLIPVALVPPASCPCAAQKRGHGLSFDSKVKKYEFTVKLLY